MSKAEYKAAWYQANKERMRELQRAYYKENKEKILAQQKEYREDNREKLRAKRERNKECRQQKWQEWYAENKGSRGVYWGEYYEANKEQLAEYQRARRRQKPEFHRAANNRRHARKLGAEGSHTIEEWQAVLDEHGHKCANCESEENITRDHIRPLIAGGTDYIENIQPLCRSCNSKKGARV